MAGLQNKNEDLDFFCKVLVCGSRANLSIETMSSIIKEIGPKQVNEGGQASKSKPVKRQENWSSPYDSCIVIERQGRRYYWTADPWTRFDTMTLDDLYYHKTIGLGAFGRVALVEDWWTGTPYALKILSINEAFKNRQTHLLRNERETLHDLRRHPFIVNMFWHSKDFYNVYFLMEFVNGGELFSYLRKAGTFPQTTSAFYAAELVLALEYMHENNIAHRDIKPENLLLDKDGHLKITDFGSATRLWFMTREVVGTTEYLAPEMIMDEPYTKAVDWWTLGILIFEMQAGQSPFFDPDVFVTWRRALARDVKFPEKNFDVNAKDLVVRLLTDEKHRLGFLHDADEIKRHPYFAKLNWVLVLTKSITPPIIPIVHFPGDTQNFPEIPEICNTKIVNQVKKVEYLNF